VPALIPGSGTLNGSLANKSEGELRGEVQRLRSNVAGDQNAGLEPDPETIDQLTAHEHELKRRRGGRKATSAAARTISLSDVPPTCVQWLWPPYLPLGKLATFDGDPGLGKSTIAIDLAARVSTGRPMPNGRASDLDGPADVIFMSAEDDPSDTIRPRCDAAGGNVRRIHLLNTVVEQSPTGPLELPWTTPRHVTELDNVIRRHRVRLVVIDPLTAFVSRDVKLISQQDATAALYPLAKVAGLTGCTILVVRHLTKTGGSNPLYRGGGAITIMGQSRAGMVVAPEEPGSRWRALAGTKNNVGPGAPTMTYQITSDHDGRSRIQWGGPSERSAADILGETDVEETSARREIADLLRHATEQGAIRCGDARNEIMNAGFRVSDRTISRAARDAGLTTRTTASFPASRYWARKDQEVPSEDSAQCPETISPSVATEATRKDAEDQAQPRQSPGTVHTECNPEEAP
jgi:hypothetical protein